MGFFDRAKSMFGRPKAERAESEIDADVRKTGRKNRADRPPLPEVSGAASATIEDALKAREAGSPAEARAILAAIDKGQGLRTVLRAAAALEAGDEEDVGKLLPLVQKDSPAWQLRLQVAAGLEPGERRDAFVARAAQLGAPAWSRAWLAALSSDEKTARAGLVDLLFEDAPLARTVAARDLALPGVKPDNDAIRRYAAFAHGRDLIRRFGPEIVARLVDRADGVSA